MATKKKLNVKFLALVLGIAGVVVAVVGAVVLVQYRNDPVKHIRQGDALLAEGEPSKAFRQYFRGIGKAPFEMDYYDKALVAVEQVSPASDFEAREQFQNLMATLIAKAEKARPQDGRTAEEVRAEMLARVLDEMRIYLLGIGLADPSVRVAAYRNFGDRLRPIDNAIRQVPPNQRDSRMAAAVRHATLEAEWRAGLLNTDSQWRNAEDGLREAIELDPTYVPGWYGLLRGKLDRVEQALRENGARAARRLLEGDDGFVATLAAAREAIGDAPAPEIDLLEFELLQAALYLGEAGDDPDDLVPVPEAAVLLAIRDEVPALGELPGWESRWRLEEMLDAAIRVAARPSAASTDPAMREGISLNADEIVRSVVETMRDSDPEDVRSLLIELSWASQKMKPEPEVAARLIEVIEALKGVNRDRVGVDALVYDQARRQAARLDFERRIDLAIDDVQAKTPIEPERLAELIGAYDRMQEVFAAVEGEPAPPRLLEATMIRSAFLGLNARNTEDEALAAQYFEEGSRAANQLRQVDGHSLGVRGLNAAMVIAEARGDWGLALDLYSSAFELSMEAARDLSLRVRLVDLYRRAGRFEEALAMIPELRDAAESAGDAIILTRLDAIEKVLDRSIKGVDLSEVRGADLLAAAGEAARRGDVDARRQLLQRIVDDPEVIDFIRMQGLTRLASLEAGLNDFDEARRYAQMILELDPRNGLALLILQSDGDSSLLERCRVLADNAAVDEVGRLVALARLLAAEVDSDDFDRISAAERAEITAELDRIETMFRADAEPGVEIVRYLIQRALDQSRLPDAVREADRLAKIEPQPSQASVLLRAQVLGESGALDDAIALIRDSIDNRGLGDDGMYVILGDFLSTRGEKEAAIDAYASAFGISPTRPINALKYAEALLAEGRTMEALPVFRAARASGRDNMVFLDRWLLQEMRIGNHQMAITERRRRRDFNPADFRNGIALVTLLMKSPIGRTDVLWTAEDVRNGERGAVVGEPRYTEADWARMRAEDRQAATLEGRKARIAEAARVLERMRSIDPKDPAVAIATARFLEEADPENGEEQAQLVREEIEERLRSAIADAEDENERRRLEVRLSRVLIDKGEVILRAKGQAGVEEAELLFAEALEIEDERFSEVETLVSSLYQSLRMSDLAIPYQQLLLAEREALDAPLRQRADIAQRLVELMVEAKMVAEAEPIVEKYFRSGNETAGDLVALGAYTVGRAVDARDGRDDAEDDRHLALLDEAADYYARAKALRATDFNIAYAELVIHRLRHLWADVERQPELYGVLRGQAIDVSSRFANLWPARRALLEVLLLAGASDGTDEDTWERRVRESANQIRAFLEIDPTNEEARLALIDLLRSEGQADGALDVAQAALDRDPTNRGLAVRVGQLRSVLGQYDEAARQFALLFQQTGDPIYLTYQVLALMEREPPDARAVIDLARANGSIIANDPFLGGMYAAAMAASGRRDVALRNYESLYRKSRAAAEQIDRSDPRRYRELASVSRSLGMLFDATEEGNRDLNAFVETISDGDPTVSDLMISAANWQDLVETMQESREPDAEAIDRANRATLDLLRRATVVDPEHPDVFAAFMQSGILLERLDMCDEAIEAFDRAFQIRPNSAEAMNNLAYLLLECDGDAQRALDLASKAVELRSDSAANRDTLGYALLRLSKEAADPADARSFRSRARDELRVAVLLGDTPAPLIRLAECEIADGRNLPARNALVKAGDLGPNAEQQARIDELIAVLGGAQ